MATTEAIGPLNHSPFLLTPSADFHARFSRDAYHRLFEIGLIDPDSRVELVDGEIFMMSPMGAPQGGYIGRLADFFTRHLPENLFCRVQMPIIAGDHSEPEPDIAIVNRRDDDYKNEHPSTGDVALIIEVAASSLGFDLGKKLNLYASSRIPEYWVVDVERDVIHVHRLPAGNRYSDVVILKAGETATPTAAPPCQVSVDWLFR
jgi:Uma2 family endonuclease